MFIPGAGVNLTPDTNTYTNCEITQYVIKEHGTVLGLFGRIAKLSLVLAERKLFSHGIIMKASNNTSRMLERNRFFTIFSFKNARSQLTWVQGKVNKKRITARKLLKGIPNETCSLTSRNEPPPPNHTSSHLVTLFNSMFNSRGPAMFNRRGPQYLNWRGP